MREEHVELRAKKAELHDLLKNPERLPYQEFVKELNAIADYLTRELGNHIFKEDNILYQVALQVIEEERWKKIKEQCDAIGYCCFTPAE